MYGLTSTLSTASEALNAESGAIAITNNNIANVNTVGYSRQLVNLSASALSGSAPLQDNGVTFGGFTSVRDEVLQIAINQKTSDAGSLGAQNASWTQIQSAFSGTTTGLAASLSNFFSAISGLSTAPSDSATRQTAFSSAQQLVSSFHQAASSLSDAQESANQSISGTVAQINQLSGQIASLDGQLAQLAPGQDGGSTEDTRDQLTNQLAQLVGVTSISTDATPTLALSGGTPLVMGNTAFSLQVSQAPDGTWKVLDGAGNDITADITGGSLGGSLAMRDTEVPTLSNTLDQLATDFASAMNTAQSAGYDATGGQGQAMFSVPTGGTNTAAGIAVSLSSGSGIAASSSGASGSSGNVQTLLAVQTQTLSSGETPLNAYASLVQTIGSSSASVTANLTATQAAVTQLTTQQSSSSGVSVDEETTNLIRYQQAYSAAAQVISTVNNLFSVVLNMSTVTG